MLNKVEPDQEFNLLVTIAGLVHVKMNTARSFVFLIGNVLHPFLVTNWVLKQ